MPKVECAKCEWATGPKSEGRAFTEAGAAKKFQIATDAVVRGDRRKVKLGAEDALLILAEDEDAVTGAKSAKSRSEPSSDGGT